MGLVKDFSIISYSALDIGKKRKINEDNLLIFEPSDTKTFLKKGNLYIVADGVGGLKRGDIASKIAVETIKDEYYSSKSINSKRALIGAIKKANLTADSFQYPLRGVLTQTYIPPMTWPNM